MHPEDGSADQEVAQRAAADAGGHGEEDEGHERLPFFGREQRARDREHGNAENVEKDERVGKVRKDRRGHGGRLAAYL